MRDVLLVSLDDPGALEAALRSDVDALLDLGDADRPGDRAARRLRLLETLLLLSGAPPSALAMGPGTRPGSPARDPDAPAKRRTRGRSRRMERIASSAHAAQGHLLPRGERRGDPDAALPTTIVRVAPLPSGLVDADLDAVLPGAPGAVLLPGAVGGADLQHLAAKLAVREAEHGLAAGRTGIVAAPAGTAAGVLALGTLAGATPRLRSLLWDPAPLAAALGTALDASPVRTARDLLILAASACGIPAIDGGPAAEAARHDGFAGRLLRVP